MKLKVCTQGLRHLDRDFWRAFLQAPITGFGLVVLTVVTAARDFFWWVFNIEPPDD